MKRNIICHKCQKNNPLRQYDGEWIKRIGGKAKDHFVCDLCGEEIQLEEFCFAESMGLNSHPYHSWEELFIEI